MRDQLQAHFWQLPSWWLWGFVFLQLHFHSSSPVLTWCCLTVVMMYFFPWPYLIIQIFRQKQNQRFQTDVEHPGHSLPAMCRLRLTVCQLHCCLSSPATRTAARVQGHGSGKESPQWTQRCFHRASKNQWEAKGQKSQHCMSHIPLSSTIEHLKMQVRLHYR